MKRALNLILLAALIIYSIIKIVHNPLLYGVASAVGIAFIIEELFVRKWDVTVVSSLGIAFVFLDITFNKVRWDYLAGFLKDINWMYLVPVAVMVFLSIGLRSWKWRFLLKEKVPFRNLAEATFIGFMANTILPARLGELVRAFLLAEKQKLPKSTVLVTVAMDRIFDGIGLITFFMVFLLVSPFAKGKFMVYGIIGSGFYLAILALFILLYFFHGPFGKVITSIVKVFSKKAAARTGEFLARIIEGMHLFRNFGSFLAFLFCTWLNWCINLSILILLCVSCNALGLFQISGVSFITLGLLLLVIISLAVTIPAGPGGAGPYQGFVLFALVLLNPAISTPGLLQSKAAGFSLYIWLAQGVFVILYGFLFMIIGGYSIKSLKAGSESGKR